MQGIQRREKQIKRRTTLSLSDAAEKLRERDSLGENMLKFGGVTMEFRQEDRNALSWRGIRRRGYNVGWMERRAEAEP